MKNHLNIIGGKMLSNARANNSSLKYQKNTPSGCKDKGISKFEFVAKTQFLWIVITCEVVY